MPDIIVAPALPVAEVPVGPIQAGPPALPAAGVPLGLIQAGPSALPTAEALLGPAQGTRSCRGVMPDTTVALPLCAYGCLLVADSQNVQVPQPLQYWPFSSADLYNWKTNHPPFSEDPQRLTGIVESLMFSHPPTWDDCQQLLQTLFTIEERERILLEAQRNVPGEDGWPSQLPNVIDTGIPFTRLRWDFDTAEGRE